MAVNRENALVICVSPGINGKWDVSEKGYEHPLASFSDREEAYIYAAALTASKEGSTVLVEDKEGFSPLPAQYRQGHRFSGTGGNKNESA